MTTRAQNIKLAIFFLLAAAALVVLLVAFLGLSAWKDVNTYYVHVPGSVDGLEPGGAVKRLGVRVGRIGDFELDPGSTSVRVSLEIDPEVRIPKDAKAFVKFQGVTGLKLIDVLEGSPTAPPLPSGGTLTYGETALEKLADQAADLAMRSAGLIDKADLLLSRLVAVAERLDVERFNRGIDNVDRLLLSLNDTSQSLNALVHDGRRELQNVSGRTNATLEELQLLARNANGVAERADRASHQVERLIRSTDAPLRATLYNLRDATQSLKDLGRTLSQNPSSLLFSNAPPERKLP